MLIFIFQHLVVGFVEGRCSCGGGVQRATSRTQEPPDEDFKRYKDDEMQQESSLKRKTPQQEKKKDCKATRQEITREEGETRAHQRTQLIRSKFKNLREA